MFELTIKDKVYQFRFGMGFVRDIDKTKQEIVEGNKVDVGLNYAVAGLLDEDPIEVVDLLLIANKTENPRVTRALLDEYIEDENTNFEAICKEILGFFETGNATKKRTEKVKEFVAKKIAAAQAE
jgi:hypothetical protein